jgi:hypothetical protein
MLTSIVLIPTLVNGFLFWDDGTYVYQNPLIREFSWPHLRQMFAASYASNYHPLTLLSHLADWQLWGEWAPGHHASNLAIHLMNTWLVWLLCREASPARVPWGAPLPCGPAASPRLRDESCAARSESGQVVAVALAALVFGIHPLHVQSVAWIAERKDVLCTCFFLLAILAQVRWRSMGTRYGLVWVALAGLAALASKPMAVSLAAVLVAYDRLVAGVAWRRAVAAQAPLILASVAFGAATWSAQSAHAIGDVSRLAANGLSAFHALAFYVEKLVCPTGLLAHYPRDPAWQTVGLATISAVVIWAGLAYVAARIHDPACRWGIAFFVLSLAPVSGLVPIGLAPVADRYAYLPSIGLVVCLGRLLGRGIDWVQGQRRPGKLAPSIGVMLGVAALGALGVLAWQRCTVWRNDRTLWTDVLQARPDSGLARVNFGYALWRTERALEAAIEQFEQVRRADVDGQYKLARMNRAVVQAELLGVRDATATELEMLLTTEPLDDNRFVTPTLVRVYDELARGALARHEHDAAVSYCEAALRLAPSHTAIQKRLTLTLLRMGDVRRALVVARTAVEFAPDDAAARVNLARIAALAGELSSPDSPLGDGPPSAQP